MKQRRVIKSWKVGVSVGAAQW